MKVFLKYISKNMLEKKGRFFLLLISIAISTALLVASAGIVNVVVDSFNAQYDSGKVGDVRIVSDTEDPYIGMDQIKSDGLKDLIGELLVTGIVDSEEKVRYVTLRGRQDYIGQMTEGNADFMRKTVDGEPSCIISKRVAEHDGLKAGDEMTFFLSGEEIKVKIGAISANEDIFYSDKPEAFTLVIPYSWMDEKLGAEGKFNCIFGNVASGEVDDFVKSFNESNAGLTAQNTKGEVVMDSSVSIGLYTMMLIVVIVSAIIIYGVFKLIMTERMSVIGTFMSQGATKKKVERIILLEGMLYGLIGGAVGCVIGETLLYFIGRLISPLADYGIYTPFEINWIYIAAGMIFSVVLSVASAYFPVRSIRKYEAKDVILNRVEQKAGKVLAKRIIGGTLMTFAIVCCCLSGDAKSNMAPFAFAAAYAGIVLITPVVVKGVTWLLGKLFRNNATLYLAMNNIHSSKLLRNNIVLIVISLSSVLMIASFGKSMTDMVTKAYEDMEYDYSISGILESDPSHSTTDKIVEKLESYENISSENINPMYFGETKADDAAAVAIGIRPASFARDMDRYFDIKANYAEEFEALEKSEGNAVLLPIKVKKQINKDVGDTVELTVSGNKVPFTIVGIYDGKVFDAGLGILMKEEVFKQEFHIKEASTLYFSVNGDSTSVENDMKPFLKSLGATWSTKAEDTKSNDEQNQQIVMIMEIFAYLAMIIASIGVFNNITICFFQRKKELAVMASVGMNKSKRMGLVLSESLLSVVLSIAIAIPFTILLSAAMTAFCSFIGLPMNIVFSWAQIPLYAGVITAIIFIATLSTMLKSRKLSVVQELKYE